MTEFVPICHQIQRAWGVELDPESAVSLPGGSISKAWRLSGPRYKAFVKVHDEGRIDMFAAEAVGLDEIVSHGFLRVPEVLGVGTAGTEAWLALEWIEEGGRPSVQAERVFGEHLAKQHLVTQPYYGWRRDNAIGTTPQQNPPLEDWGVFFADYRIGAQLDYGARNGFPDRMIDAGRRLQDAIPDVLADYRPPASLLHGDLWGGNWSVDEFGRPFTFDPAVYYGDPETDLAMTRLFGGFSEEFYSAYDEHVKPRDGRPFRSVLYNLYHILNHANLFGSGYVGQARRTIDMLLAEIKA